MSCKVKKKMSHRWSGDTYEDLLIITNLPTLERRRLELKLCHLFKIIHNLVYFPSNVIVHRERGHIIIFIHPMTITCPNLLPELTLIFIHLYPIPFLSGTDSPLMSYHYHLLIVLKHMSVVIILLTLCH